MKRNVFYFHLWVCTRTELRFSRWLRSIKKNAIYGDDVPLSVTHYDDLNRLKFFVKFATGVLYRKLSSELDFCVNRLFHSHTAPQDVNDFLSVTFISVYILWGDIRSDLDHMLFKSSGRFHPSIGHKGP